MGRSGRRIAAAIATAALFGNVVASAAAAQDRGTSAVVYWKLPFGGPEPSAPFGSFGFRVDQDWSFARKAAPPRWAPPPVFDMQFDSDGFRSLSFAGVDGAILLDGLGVTADEQKQRQRRAQSQYYPFAVAAVGLAAVGAFLIFRDDDKNRSTSSSTPEE